MPDDHSPAAILTDADREFLSRPLFGFLSVAAGPVPAQPRPIWFELAADDTVQFFSEAEALKVRRLAKDPRASLVVAAPVGERERWVSLTGEVSIETDGAADLCRRSAERYWHGESGREADLAAMLAGEQVRLVLHPTKVRRFAF